MRATILLMGLLSQFSSTGFAMDIVAHRGASHVAPENTLAAYVLAWELLADAAECDVHLTSDGRVVVIHDPTSGRQMVQERETLFQETYGFPSNAIASENFLTYQRLGELAAELGMRWWLFGPVPRWRWTVRRWRARLCRQREPAQFPLIVGTTV